jgi:aminoglycoside/choline kinase family phosphotransferase
MPGDEAVLTGGARCWTHATPLHGDASSRRYSRLSDQSGRTAIEALYPCSAGRELRRDVEVLQWLAGLGLRAPGILEIEWDRCRLVVEDLGKLDAAGSLAVLDATLRAPVAERLIAPLIALAEVKPASLPPWNEPLGRERMRIELAGFELWFVRYLCDRSPEPSWSRCLDRLADQIARHPRRVCHRDYHLNNLFLLEDGGVGVIDADVLVGPDTYDAVSLVYERSFPDLMNQSETVHWLEAWAAATRAGGDWRQRCRETRLQRCLKVLGTFARLHLSGRPGYSCWIPTAAAGAAEEAGQAGWPSALVRLLLDWSG